jgi:large subunit ribosomal protein L25
VRHVDFIYLNSDIQKVEIPIVYEGKDRAIGVKRGGFFNIIKRTLLVLCPVNNIPKNIVIDVRNIYVGQSIRAANINLPPLCELVDKSNPIIASIIGNRGGKAEEGASAAATS